MYLIHDEITWWLLRYQGYRATTRRKFTFNNSVLKTSRYSTDQPQKDQMLGWLCSQPPLLNREPMHGLGIQYLNHWVIAPWVKDLQKIDGLQKIRHIDHTYVGGILAAFCCGSYKKKWMLTYF